MFGSTWFGSKTNAGVTVNYQTAMQYAAVWCATRIICEPAGAMPLVTFERTNGEDREQATDYSLYDIVKTSPNDDMAAQPFWEGRYQHAVNWDGGGFSEIEREEPNNPESPVIALHPIHPCRVSKANDYERSEGYYYRVRNNDGTGILLRSWEMFHLPGVLSDDGIWSKGVIPYARQTIGFGIATEQYGASYFGSGGMPRGVVSDFQFWRDAAARRTFREDWKEVHGNPSADNIGLMPPGAKFNLLSIPNEAAQFIQTRVHNDRVIARWYMIPLHMLQDLERGTQASIEQSSIEFVIYHLWPWLMRCQGQCNLKLIPRRDRKKYFVEHNLDSLLRGDLKSRMDAYRMAIMMGVRTINECRKLENLPNIGPAGDVHYVPANMTTADVMLNSPPGAGGVGPGSDAAGQQGLPGNVTVDEVAKRLTHADRDEVDSQIDQMQKVIEHHGHRNNGTDRDVHTRNAARNVLIDPIRRMFTKEVNAAKRAAPKENFSEWAKDFYSKHRVTLTEALQPATGLLNAIGVTITADAMAERIITDSKERITAALSENPAALLAVLDSWPTQRAEQTADELMGAITKAQ